MMKRKGQVLGTPFIMIFALVVGALILVGGLYYVFKLTDTAKEISIMKEINDFKATVKTYYFLEEGNSKRIRISFPAQAKNICFYDPEKRGWKPATDDPSAKLAKTNYPPDIETKEQFYKSFFQAHKEKNMFVFPTEDFEESTFKIPYLTLESQKYNPICVRNGNYIKITSMGDHVEVQFDYTSP